MRFDIEEEHFTVFNLLLLLLVWANSCYLLVIFFRPFMPILVTTLLVLSGLALTLAMVVITLYISVKWVRHHNLGWWFLAGVIVLFVLSYALESTVRNIFVREQLFRQEQMR
jgi:dolichyl-phosphate-mannose--protein O-mannosyl transferase